MAVEVPMTDGQPSYERMLSDLGIEPPIPPGEAPVFRTRGRYPEQFRVIAANAETGAIRIDHFDKRPTDAYLDNLWVGVERGDIERLSSCEVADD